MTKKGNLIYKIIVSITLFIPIPMYLFLSATLFGITPNYTINAKIDTISVFHVGDEYFITTSDKTATIDGLIAYNEVYDVYGIYIDSDDIIKIEKNYYSYVHNKNNDTYELVDIKKFEVQKQTSYKIPLSFFISLGGVLIAVLIIQGKMQWHKKYKRLATLISLLSFTVIMLVINTIVSNLLNIFLVATTSWAIYCIEYLVVKGKIDKKKAEKQESDLLGTLRGLLK